MTGLPARAQRTVHTVMRTRGTVVLERAPRPGRSIAAAGSPVQRVTAKTHTSVSGIVSAVPAFPDGVVAGADGLPRCWWCAATDEYRTYHDEEWGRPVSDDDRLFEK